MPAASILCMSVYFPMIKLFARFAVLLCLVFSSFPLFAQDTAAPRIGVMTMKPGEIFWERFGHNAIVVERPDGVRASYNFGFFDPTAPDFVSRFARGEMRYQLALLPTSEDLMTYQHEGRGVSIQWLNLTPAQATTLAQALATNAEPENAFYHYQYFTDNCSTRVRDAINTVLGGDLQKQLRSSSVGSTYRSEAVRLADDATWMRVLFDLGLGPRADRPLNTWDAAFIPGTLETALTQVQVDGKPLVASTEKVLDHKLRPDATDPRFVWWQWFIGGVAIGYLLLMLAKRCPRVFSVIATLAWIKFAVFGLALTYLWFFTVHEFAWGNHNLWLLNPLALLCAWFYWRAPKSAFNVRGLQASVILVDMVLPLLGMFMLWLTVRNGQSNAHWIALMVPLHFGLFFGVRHLQWRNGQNSNTST